MLTLNSDIYECVISNFALQWVDDLECALKFLCSKSAEVFAFSTLVDGTFKEWEILLNKYQPMHLLKYPQADKQFSLPGRKALLKSDMEYELVLIDATESSIERPKKDKSVFIQGKIGWFMQ